MQLGLSRYILPPPPPTIHHQRILGHKIICHPDSDQPRSLRFRLSPNLVIFTFSSGIVPSFSLFSPASHCSSRCRWSSSPNPKNLHNAFSSRARFLDFVFSRQYYLRKIVALFSLVNLVSMRHMEKLNLPEFQFLIATIPIGYH